MTESTLPCSFCSAIAINRCTTSGCAAPVCAQHGRAAGAAHFNTGPDSGGHYFMQIIECERCRIAREQIEHSGAYKDGQAFRKWRIDKGLSLRRTSYVFGISPTDLSRIERGLQYMTDDVRAQADVLMGKGARSAWNVVEMTKRDAGPVEDDA